MVGVEEEVGQTKSDRMQKGETKALPCTTDCTGSLTLDEQGRIDTAALCPVHLLLHLKRLVAERLHIISA